jgi:hypothetical protein
MKDELLALATRVEELTGPDREVDAAIMGQFTHDVESDDGDFWWQPHGEQGQRVPDFTGSLDAVLLLLLSGWDWLKCLDERGHTIFAVYGPDGSELGRAVYCLSDVLALLTAILRARAQAQEAGHGD